MQPQVEVAVIEANEMYVKVFCEHRPGGFVKLMEAFYALGFEVIHATVTRHKGLVSNVFKVEVTLPNLEQTNENYSSASNKQLTGDY